MERVAASFLALALLAVPAFAQSTDQTSAQAADINGATYSLGGLSEQLSPLVAKIQILLDRAHVSPGVIDGYAGDNVHKAIAAFEEMHGLPVDGDMDFKVWQALDAGGDALTSYTITEKDLEGLVDAIPDDYAEMAKMQRLGFTSVAEKLAERFHMDEDFLKTLNKEADFDKAGTTIMVADPGKDLETKVSRIEVDTAKAQVRAYGEADKLIAAYPATIGSAATPSPNGTHEVKSVATDPTYAYRPDENFQQGDNDQPLDLPPGPNGPVGSVWIDLSEPTYGIHGTPEPSQLGKESSHGCVRLTNWDAKELSENVSEGIEVKFLDQ